ncbi:MAG TPA: hypothetical protein VLA46_08325 [Saprospiraceae bacterium]|nr:hypothetical protein [Saprospiraceae bacterium]
MTCLCRGQADLPVTQWIKKLSVKHDTRSENFRAVYSELLKLDSTAYCLVMHRLRKQGPMSDVRYLIRLEVIQASLKLQLKTCPDQRPTIEVLKEVLQFAYEIGDEALIFQVHRTLATEYTHQLNYGSAALHAMIAIDLTEKLGEDNLYLGPNGWYMLGYVLYHSREYEASIKATKTALLLTDRSSETPMDTLSLFYKMNAFNTIGLAYEKLNKPDSAFLAFGQAMKIADPDTNTYWKGVITGNMGDVYYQLGQYDSAKVMLTYDYQQSLEYSQNDNAANSLQWLARIELHDGNAVKALGMLREAQRLLQHASTPAFTANTLYAFTQAFSDLGMADSMNIYMHQYLTLHDSIEKEANNNRLDLVHMRMDNQSNINKVITLSKEKKRIALIRNFIIAFLLLLVITGYLILNRQKLRLKVREMEALDEKRQAEQAARVAREQLDVYTLHLREKTNLVETLQDQLMKRELSEEQYQQISALSQHSILTDEDWETFKNMFERVYPGFFHSLRQQSADITLAEMRMAALCKLQVPSKEAANLLGISPNSVNKTRQRLRSRLGLDPEANLEQYFSV